VDGALVQHVDDLVGRRIDDADGVVDDGIPVIPI
jgi:hypothetical protein